MAKARRTEAETPDAAIPGADTEDALAEEGAEIAGDVESFEDLLGPAAPQGESEGEEDWQGEVDPAYLQSKYTLVSIAAKRARQILAGSPPRVDTFSEKPVTIALEELTQGKLVFVRLDDPH